jgi:hypothetical protein
LSIPDDRLSFLYHYGMYKFAGLTNPAGVAATLQGPWIEEYQMPPWSGDYHFNINVQMCYWPAYHGNCMDHLLPLFDLVWSWRDKLAHNARMFLGIDDGFMLPHAVSDRCTCIGGFWAGSLDHGCTAWVAQMMYRYYRYTMDETFLRERAYPFMKGAMRVYEGMLDCRDGRYELPVSVSPEYHSKAGMAWGRNASFQLACIHRLGEDLLDAARTLGVRPDPRWRKILRGLPKASLTEGGEPRVAVWDGTELEESHRHHSHLGGIVPFDVFDPADRRWQPVLHASLNRWIYHGPGLWSGWCVPWAAMIHTRFGQGAAARSLLETWQRVFTNEGHGTLHDAHIPGFTLFGAHYGHVVSVANGVQREIMQIEAGMAATAAIQEMFLHTRRGVTHVMPAVPGDWRTASFAGMRTDGGFLVSARLEDGRVASVTVESPFGGPLRLSVPWTNGAIVRRNGRRRGTRIETPLIQLETAAGDRLEFVPA